MPLEKPLDQLHEGDLLALKEQLVSEGRTIDYKRESIGGSDDDKREFRADATSFANAAGGHIIFGIEEADGVPVNIDGITALDPDAEILRLESILRENVQPRIPRVQSIAVRLKNGGHCIVIRIHRSWAFPHAVLHKKYLQFFSRTSNGKYQLDVPEVRAAFLTSDSITDRIKEFRIQRLSKLIADVTPVPLDLGPKFICQAVPMSSMSSPTAFDPDHLIQVAQPIFQSRFGYSWRFNLEGAVVHSLGEYPQPNQRTSEYAQLYRNGTVEIAYAANWEGKQLDAYYFEDKLLGMIAGALSYHRALEMDAPTFLMVSALSVEGCSLQPSRAAAFINPVRRVFDRSELLFDTVMADELEADVHTLSKPLLDALWNAAGWAGSLSYDEDGAWNRRTDQRSHQ